MSYTRCRISDVDSKIPAENGSMKFLRESLETKNLGFTVFELKPNKAGMEHDHAEDGIEELYYVTKGRVTVTIDDEPVELSAGEAVRIDADATRQIAAGDDGAQLVLASAPS